MTQTTRLKLIESSVYDNCYKGFVGRSSYSTCRRCRSQTMWQKSLLRLSDSPVGSAAVHSSTSITFMPIVGLRVATTAKDDRMRTSQSTCVRVLLRRA